MKKSNVENTEEATIGWLFIKSTFINLVIRMVRAFDITLKTIISEIDLTSLSTNTKCDESIIVSQFIAKLFRKI